MAKIKSTEKIVLSILKEYPPARKDDYLLMCLVCQRVNGDLLDKTFWDVMAFHKENGLPNWETVTRCRRKIQERFPYLKDSEVAQARHKEEQEYIDYAMS